jgi:hypothetical protein
MAEWTGFVECLDVQHKEISKVKDNSLAGHGGTRL